MTGLELVAAYLLAWLVRKARRVGRGLDAEVDQALDVGLERLHGVVAAKLGDDPVMSKLEREAVRNGQLSERTRRRVQDAVMDAIEDDQVFAANLSEALQELERIRAGDANIYGIDLRGAQGVQVGGHHNVQSNTFRL